jgi:hypothetical protein
LFANLVVSWVNPLPHKPILWPVKARTLDTSLQHFYQCLGTCYSTWCCHNIDSF